jgi:YVTN family beta-propeller protein
MASGIRGRRVLALLIVSLAQISVPLAVNVPVSAAGLSPADSFPVGPDPVGIAIGPPDVPGNGIYGIVYVANHQSGKVSHCAEVAPARSCDPFYPSAYFSSSRGLGQIAVDDNTHWAYVTNTNDNSISLFVSGNYSSQTIPVGRQPFGIAVDSTTHRIYVANSADGTLSVLAGISVPAGVCENSGTETCPPQGVYRPFLLDTIRIGHGPISVAADSATRQVFVTNSLDGTVSVVDTTNNHVSTVAVGRDPYGVATDPIAKRAYVTNSGDDTVSVIDEQKQNKVVATMPVGMVPHGIAVDSTTNDVLVANSGDNTVSSFHASVSPVVRSVSVGTFPESVAVDPVAHRVFVTNVGQGTVSEFIDPNAEDIIYVPVRFCALEGTATAGTAKGFVRQHPDMAIQGPIVPNSIHTVVATELAARLQIADDTIWQPQAHIRFVMAGGTSPFPIPVDPADPSDHGIPGFLGGGELYDTPLGEESASTECQEAWNILHPGYSGIPAVDVKGYWTNNLKHGGTVAPSTDLRFSPRLWAEPRTLTVSDITRLTVTVQDPYTGDPLQWPYNVQDGPYVLAHELGHALTLGHGQGVDQYGQGLQPAGDGLTPTNPGRRIYDEYCDPKFQTESFPGVPNTLMTYAGDSRDTLLTPLQIEQARDIARIYPGSWQAISNRPWVSPVSVIVDTLCANLPCGIPRRLAIVSAAVWFYANSPTAVLSFSPLLISSTDPRTNYFVLVTSSMPQARACSLSNLHFPTGTASAYLAAKVVLDKGQTSSIQVWQCQDGLFRSLEVTAGNVTVSNRATQAAYESGSPVSGVDIKFPAQLIRSLKSSLRLEVISQDWHNTKLTFQVPETSGSKPESTGNIAHTFVWVWILVAGLVVLATAWVIGSRRRRA